MGTYYYLFYSFIVYGFIGWLIEVFYHIYTDKRFINRGFLHGPICPIYGISAVLFIVTLHPLNNNSFLLFLGGALVASAVEYLTGYGLYVLFNTRWWDYTMERFNIKGYICLKFSVIWGILSVIFIKYINPGVSKAIYILISKFGEIPYNIALILLIIDSTITINSLISFKSLFLELEDVIRERKENIDRLMEKALNAEREKLIRIRIMHLEETRERLISKISFSHRRLIKSYPRITSKKFGLAIDLIREKLKNRV